MWLEVKWYDSADALLRTDGEWGPLFDENGLPVEVTDPASGQPVQVKSILDLDDPNTKIYEAHYGLTQEWANQLLGLGYPADLALGYDRLSGDVEHTLGDLGAEPAGAAWADVNLQYQITSWEYVQFLYLANDGSIPFLADEGVNMLEAWLNTGMSAPYTMASVAIAVPEPGGVAMLLAGVGFLATVGRRRARW
jgi:hypothetical protein